MGTRTTSNRSSTGTRYEWRWLEDAESDPFVIPDSWAENGRKEQPAEDGEEFFALEVKHGLVLEYEVSDTGQLIKGPLREKEALRVLYVSASGEKTIVRQVFADDNNVRGIKPPSDFISVIAGSPGASTGIYESPSAAKRGIAAKYGSKKVCVEDD